MSATIVICSICSGELDTRDEECEHDRTEDCMVCRCCGRCREDLDSDDTCRACGGVDEN